MTPTSATLAQAHTLHQQGRLTEAVSLYRQVLAREPLNGDALHLMGLALVALGDAPQAVRLIGSAVQLQPANAAVHANLGGALSVVGRFSEALSSYDRALALQPDLPVAHRGRGAVLMQLGQPEAALASFRQALRLAPNDDSAHNGLGVALERTNHPQEARQCFSRAIALNPANVDAHHNLGLIEAAAGRHAEALASIERALALQPNQPALHGNRGGELLALGRPAEALASFDRALALAPQDPTAHHNRGLALAGLGRPAEALASFERALELAPGAAPTHLWRGKTCLELGRPEEALASFDRARTLAPQEFAAHFDRGVALARLKRHEEALASFDQAVRLNGSFAEAFNNRGAVLVRMFQPAAALPDFVRAVDLKPDYVEAHTNAGITLRGLGRHSEALESLDRALVLKPGDRTATWCKALLKLGAGEFREGWPLYEVRLSLEAARGLQRSFDKPRWMGDESLAGRTLLAYAEQGLGDTLQFCRYIPRLEELGARVVLEVQPVLKPLLGSLAMRGMLVGRAEPLPEFDFHTPLGSLPLALHTELATIPGGVPYLHVDARAIRTWGERLATLPGLKVGLNWCGNPEAEKLAALEARSFPLATAAALARVPGVSLVSLQKGAGSEQRTRVEFGEAVAQLTDPAHMGPDEIANETAAILKGLDLVITADTALAHLAGALGVRVWVVLQAVPDWRWLTERADSPWYPTMRLFRQRTPGDWPEVFERVAAELAGIAGGG
jgi:tetratricopeptide (TPR) repeat protein